MKQKILILVLVVAGLCLAQPVLEKKPVISTEKPWNGKSYMKVTLTDGSRVELKSDKSLTKEQWQKLADDYQKIIDNQPPEPERCEDCHDSCGRKP